MVLTDLERRLDLTAVCKILLLDCKLYYSAHQQYRQIANYMSANLLEKRIS